VAQKKVFLEIPLKTIEVEFADTTVYGVDFMVVSFRILSTNGWRTFDAKDARVGHICVCVHAKIRSKSYSLPVVGGHFVTGLGLGGYHTCKVR
jgi:hypothetical protein